jgi:phosphoglycolate phosphatase-like HAD superfamily hydrolase
MNDPQILKNLKPAKEFFIGLDSDGCVFDVMELKHKECFAPVFIKQFRLQTVNKYAREVWDFVNLYSKTRGANRFKALARALNLLRERKEVIARGVAIPGTAELEAWMARSNNLSNAALKKEVEAGHQALAPALAWSEGVNQMVADLDASVPPFPFVRESLQKMIQRADVIVVSQAPHATLAHEWKEHGIDQFVRVLAGQELGTKDDHIKFAAGGKYPADRILMIGDAPGDLKAARSNQALFYPIVPGREEASWEKLLREGLDRFLAGTYAGAYEAGLIQEFDASLPEKPNW